MRRWSTLWLLVWPLAVMLALATLSQLPFTEVARSIRALTAGNWLVWVALNLLILMIAALRWQLLAKALGVELALRQFMQVRQAGSAVNFLTPGPQFGGEPLQVLWLHRVYKLPLPQAVLVLGLDRFFETAINLLMLLTLVLLLGLTRFTTQNALQVLVVLMLALLLLTGTLVLLLLQPRWLSDQLAALTLRWDHYPVLARIHQHWQQSGHTLRHACSKGQGRLWWALLLSMAGWVALMAELILVLHWLGITLSPDEFVLMLVSLRLSMLLPLPGGIGSVEAALLWSFRLLQLPATAAMGMIALIRLRDAVVLAGGLACLWWLTKRQTQAATVAHEVRY